ncbi:MAG: hypothetical protein LQ337_001690 [Flavoplaca oasis]|nr:MAG: hypothetical protein LQ337_001690 [Flavoplaca oasis]
MADATFYTAINNPNIALRIMEDPLAAHLNLAIHGLLKSLANYCLRHNKKEVEQLDPPRSTFSLALHMTLAKTITYQAERDIIAIIRAAMQVLVTYSLIHNQYGWVGDEAHRAIEDLTAKISLLLHFGTKVPPPSSSESSMKRSCVDAVMIFKNKGMVYTHFSTIISKFVELDKMLQLNSQEYVMFRPEGQRQRERVRVLSRLLKLGRHDMAGGALALLVHFPARYYGGW